MWIARDFDGRLFLFYGSKPEKGDRAWVNINLSFSRIDEKLFPEIKWEDEEPTEVELVIKK